MAKEAKKRGRPELTWVQVPASRAKEFVKLHAAYQAYSMAYRETLNKMSKVKTNNGLVVRAISVRRAARPEDIRLGFGQPASVQAAQEPDIDIRW